MIDRVHINYKQHKTKNSKRFFKQEKFLMLAVDRYDPESGEKLDVKTYRIRPEMFYRKRAHLSKELEDLEAFLIDMEKANAEDC